MMGFVACLTRLPASLNRYGTRGREKRCFSWAKMISASVHCCPFSFRFLLRGNQSCCGHVADANDDLGSPTHDPGLFLSFAAYNRYCERAKASSASKWFVFCDSHLCLLSWRLLRLRLCF